MPVSHGPSETSIANNGQDTSYPSPVSKAIVTGVECVWQRSTIHLFRGFQKENKEKDGRKVNGKISA